MQLTKYKKISFFLCFFLSSAILLACKATAPVVLPSPTKARQVIEIKATLATPTEVVALLGEIITPTPIATPTATIEPSPSPSAEVIPPTVTSTLPPIPVIVEPQAISETVMVSCGDIDANWGQNWEVVIIVLDQLIANSQSCGEEPLSHKKYAAYFSYAISLENAGQVEAAIVQYQAALLINPQRSEALKELIRLEALPEPTPVACSSTSPPLPDPASPDSLNPALFVTVQGNQLQLNGQPFKVKGVNYYPRHAPWHRFIEEADMSEVALELKMIKEAGFNTIRIFLRYEPLFICRPEDAIPNEAAFAKVDRLFQLAEEHKLQLIVTLNDLPDLIFRPLYTDWAHYEAQTVYIVRRYRNQPNILAWDLRNEGDLEYGVRPGDTPQFSQEEVLGWLAHLSQLVREHDPHHLLTVGWWGDPTLTSPYVDILSFHHWFEADQLQARLSDYKQRNEKPLLLQEVGYHSWASAPQGSRDGTGQADILGRVIKVSETEDISGWLVWTAFDFAPKPGEPYNYEHHFGLWQTDLTPKPALQALPLQ